MGILHLTCGGTPVSIFLNHVTGILPLPKEDAPGTEIHLVCGNVFEVDEAYVDIMEAVNAILGVVR